jgi:hypothetical protein
MTLTYADAYARAGSHPVRHLLLALLVPLGLTAGLLTFPTVCACGEPLPHDHALFTLAGHQHDAHDAHDAHAHPHPHPHPHDGVEHGADEQLPGTPADTAHTHGVALEAPTTNTAGEAHALLPAPNVDTLPASGLAILLMSTRRADLWRGAPPAPPPRAQAWHGRATSATYT